MIVRMGIVGDGVFRVQGESDVCGVYSLTGAHLDVVAAECRNYFRASVPVFENLLRSTWEAVGNVAAVDAETGDASATLSGAGWIYISTYRHGFDYAVRLLCRGVHEQDLGDINAAFVHGVVSLDAYFLCHTPRWNKEHPEDQLLDTSKHRTSFKQKLETWLPKLTGVKFPFDGDTWRDFTYLQGIRHDEVIHPKSDAGAVTLEDLAKRVNTFRTGIADFLYRLHLPFRMRVPSSIIRACFLPECVLVDGDSESVKTA